MVVELLPERAFQTNTLITVASTCSPLLSLHHAEHAELLLTAKCGSRVANDGIQNHVRHHTHRCLHDHHPTSCFQDRLLAHVAKRFRMGVSSKAQHRMSGLWNLIRRCCSGSPTDGREFGAGRGERGARGSQLLGPAQHYIVPG